MERRSREHLLRVGDLTVEYLSGKRCQLALDGVSFDMLPAEVIGILGESGSGKTTLALAVLRLLPPSARIVRGAVQFRGRDMLALNQRQLQRIRGAEISMIFQEPGLALNPVMRAIDQVAEVIRAHRGWSTPRCREEARRVLEEVRLEGGNGLLSAYPHQLSGGERQRLVVAQALACRPALVIADEPTASIDSTLQAELLRLLKELRERMGLAMLLITHNPAILAGLADQVLVLYAGRIVEKGTLQQMVREPLHPYTALLFASVPPGPGSLHKKTHLNTIPGNPAPGAFSMGCRFEGRCPERMPLCAQREPMEIELDGRTVRCFKYGG